jgi:hypothetical protein
MSFVIGRTVAEPNTPITIPYVETDTTEVTYEDMITGNSFEEDMDIDF